MYQKAAYTPEDPKPEADDDKARAKADDDKAKAKADDDDKAKGHKAHGHK